MPRSKHRSDLGYTEAVLHESMRLATVAACGLPHVTTCDTSVGKRHTSLIILKPIFDICIRFESSMSPQLQKLALCGLTFRT